MFKLYFDLDQEQSIIDNVKIYIEGNANSDTYPMKLYVWNMSSSSYSYLDEINSTERTYTKIFSNASEVVNDTDDLVIFLIEVGYASSSGGGIIYLDYFKMDVNYQNSAPVTTTPSLSPATAYTDSTINASSTYTDGDGDTGNVTCRWWRNSTNIYNETKTSISNGSSVWFTLSSGNFSKNDNIKCEMRAYDGTDYESWENSSTKTIQNSIPTDPTSLSLTDANVTENITATCGGSTDADGDSIVYHYYFYNTNDSSVLQGWSSDNTYVIQQSDAHDVINVTCKATTSDANSTGNYSNTKTVDNSYPNITTELTSKSKDADGTAWVYDYNVTDADGDTITWYDNTSLFDINSSTGVINDTPTESEAGSHAIRIYASDGYINTTDDFTYTINDVTSPTISYQASTTAQGTTGNNWIFINVSVTETNTIDTVQFEWNGSNESFASNDGTYWWENKTGLSSGNYTINAWANDTSGNLGGETQRWIYVDVSAPTITYKSPTPNNTNIYYSNSVTINITATDAETSVDKCTLEWNGANETFDNNDGTNWWETKATTDGTNYTINVYCNDTEGNSDNAGERWFIENSKATTVSYNMTGSAVVNDNIYCWFNATDNQNTTLTYYIDWFNSSSNYQTNSSSFTNATITNVSMGANIIKKNENWTCQITIYDGYENNTAVNTSTLTVSNSAPTLPDISSVSPSTAYTISNLTWTVENSTDADGDSITYECQVKTMIIQLFLCLGQNSNGSTATQLAVTKATRCI